MTGHRKWSEARHRGQENVPSNTSQTDLQKRLSDYANSLGELRRAREMTQQQLAKVMQVSQAQVSRVENQADLYLSTLRSYIEAMGGELQIRVAFPGANWSEVTIGDVTHAESVDSKAESTTQENPDFFVVYQYKGASESFDASGMFKSWPTAPGLVIFLDSGATFTPYWAKRSRLYASSSACGFVVHDPEEHAALQNQPSWRTPVDPFTPADIDMLVSSAELKE